MRNTQHSSPGSTRATRAKRKAKHAATRDVTGTAQRPMLDSGGVSRFAEVANPMLVGRVADTTSQRDREALDLSIVGLVQEFLGARSVALYRIEQTETGPQRVVRASAQQDAPRCESALAEGFTKVFVIEDRAVEIGQLEVISDVPVTARDATLVHGVLRILRNQLALLDYGERDTLTGLLNRKTFDARLQKVTAALRAAGSGLHSGDIWLGLVDVDHFKSVNDRHGHLFGDEVLLLVSQIMTRTFRGADELFRFGGEEFVIVLENVDENGARIAFDRLRAAVEAHVFPQSSHVTVSLGYTKILAQDVPATCIERADAALYYVKRNGRNRAQQYESLIESGQMEHQNREGEVELF
jgi:diguanylate cyclase (GGDEF)-like protein